MIHRCNPLYCIIPPHILRNVAERGNSNQKASAWRALSISDQIRGHRQALAPIAPLLMTPLIGAKGRSVYDAQHEDELPGKLVRNEGDLPTGDPAVDEAYDGAGATYDLYMEIFERNSIDDRGMRLISTVHFLKSYDNAFWNGQQMVYGDGDEDMPEQDRLWSRFTSSIDVIGHELTHGVTQFEANLAYRFQSGALNESMSDVFGSLVKQRTQNQTADRADWLIGEGLFTSNVNATAIRSMKAPGSAYDDPVLGKDPQPAHMKDYKKLAFWEDNGGVHINSGIPNHAFYRVATELGGHAWEKAGMIWYVALRDRIRWNSGFQSAANHTFQVAGELFGPGSKEQQAVKNGWSQVGINIEVKVKKAAA
ncbi:MAG: M4 family metallopeptidase [Candidatus Manganitrophus sp.]|nr:M4 family metallopeptidase [Candidatus Manganitrophus sp.]MDC4223699.1 M4 family metallopeptidase [Candidatus Manganitrophus sp.]WDT70097.1 MAG: M4 family metallopeptidase [Candidatus Manganitrophus sp.]WDT78249.1 MAG: M4 family metallopeptidase [Candidatus Manganitrophus sp.]